MIAGFCAEGCGRRLPHEGTGRCHACLKLRLAYCEDCGHATKDGKPYCTTHVLALPYARRIHEEVRRRLRGELTEAVIADVGLVLEQQRQVTIAKLAALLGVTKDMTRRAVDALQERGLISERWVSSKGLPGVSAA